MEPTIPNAAVDIAPPTASDSIQRSRVRLSMAPGRLEPMYASVGTAVPEEHGWTFEPKYDGMRVLAFVSGTRVRLMTRNGKDKAAQFPEIVGALRSLASQVRRPLILDGEVIASRRNAPGQFQALQGRFHLKSKEEIARRAAERPATLIAFDVLRDGAAMLAAHPWTARRETLETLLQHAPRGLTLGETTTNGQRMVERARRAGWEGIIAKRVTSRYAPGARSREWLKLKLQYRAEFVVGGFTEPRRTRQHIGALLLGYFDADGRLQYVGHTGGGFDRESLRGMLKRLEPLARATPPFVETPRTNEPAHWVAPKVVVEVKFAEWTSDGRLRQPIFLGVREDKDARDVHAEGESLQQWSRGAVADRAASVLARAPRAAAAERAPRRRATPGASLAVDEIIVQLEAIETDSGEGTLELGRGKSLHVSSLGKVYFGKSGITKGDLMRYYTRVSPLLLPLLEDRPLILKRYPNGIDGPSFFQQNAGAHVPSGVRVMDVEAEDGKKSARIIGGDLLTLLYTVQIGTISVHPWQSRLRTISFADYSTIDLDPGDDVSFARVVELARHLSKELDRFGLIGAVKTSGSSGLHIAMPLPARTTYARSLALAQAISEHVAAEFPELATVERRLKARPPGTTYVDAHQNARGKSVASAYSVRERAGATVSAPLKWDELTPKLRLETFTSETMPRRIARLGDIWGPVMERRNTGRTITRALEEG
jgi:bifunctional non-homologous end joining protein LigD